MMKYARRLTLLAVIISGDGILGFPTAPMSSCRPSVRLHLTSDEILARARQSTGINIDEEEQNRPKIFEDSIYADIASAYSILDKRIKEGPGSLTARELSNLEVQLGRISNEMKANQNNRPPKPSASTNDTMSAPSETSVSAVQASVADATAPEHQGPNGFDGKYGVPVGTTNTYAIDGMEEMTPEEYQVAIQEAVSARQRQRRASGVVGNKSSQNYLDALGK